MLSNSSSQVRKEGKTRSLLGRRRRGGGKIVRNTTRFAKETRRRNKKETLLAKVVEKDGAKRRETEIEGIETEAISPERWGRARFLRPALAQFCAMQVCGGTTATGYTALTGYVFRSVELETSLSLEARSTFRSIREGEGSRRRCRRRTITSMVSAGETWGGGSPLPLARWEDLFVNTARVSRVADRSGCGGGNAERGRKKRGDFLPPKGVT